MIKQVGDSISMRLWPLARWWGIIIIIIIIIIITIHHLSNWRPRSSGRSTSWQRPPSSGRSSEPLQGDGSSTGIVWNRSADEKNGRIPRDDSIIWRHVITKWIFTPDDDVTSSPAITESSSPGDDACYKTQANVENIISRFENYFLATINWL